MSPPSEKVKNLLSNVGLLYAAAIWGSTFFIVKNVLDDVDPIVLVGYRFLLAGLLLLGYLKIRRRNILKDWTKGLVLSVLLWSLYIPQTIGLKYTTASNSGFITGLFIAFVPVFLLVIFKRKPTMMEVVASVVSLIGLLVLTGGMRDINLGDMLTLIAAVTYALHLLYSDKYIKGGFDPLVASCQQFLMIGSFSLATAWLFGLPFGIGSQDAVMIILFLTLFPTLSAFVIQLLAQKIVTPVRVSLIFALEPVFAAAFAWTLGGEAIVMHRALGGLLIFLALILSGLPQMRARLRTAKQA